MPDLSKSGMIREAVERSRDSWVSYTLYQEKQIYNLFLQASNQLTAEIARFTVGGKIPPIRLTLLLQQVKTQMNQLRPRMARLIRQGQRKSIDLGIESSIRGAEVALPKGFKAGIGTSFTDKSGKLRKYDPRKELFAESTWARINGQAMDALIRTRYGGIAFSRRVWDVTWPVERQIRNQINLAVLTGSGAGKVARKVRSYLGLPETFRGMAFKEFHPGVGIYKSAYKNALRLTATEMNRGFNEGIIRYGMEKKWVTGWTWYTGSGDPCPDCADNDGQFFPKDDPPMIPLHPFCYCWSQIMYDE